MENKYKKMEKIYYSDKEYQIEYEKRINNPASYVTNLKIKTIIRYLYEDLSFLRKHIKKSPFDIFRGGFVFFRKQLQRHLYIAC